MTEVGWLPAPVEDLFGTEATAEESYEVLTVDVPPASWLAALEVARDRLTCTYFDWLSAVDEPGTGFCVAAHVVALAPVRRLLLRTTVPHEFPVLPSAVDVFAGAAWHERETHEMFGVDFQGHPALDHLLLPEGFEGHPLRKDFVLAARVAKAWPGAKEPGEGAAHGAPKRRQMLPPGVPDPNEWGPQKGQLPPAPTRPARGAGRAAAERPARGAGERPVRRARSASEGSASQTEGSTRQTAEPSVKGQEGAPPTVDTPGAPGAPGTPGVSGASVEPAAPARPRRARSASEGSTSQQRGTGTGAGEGPGSGSGPARRARSVGEGSASQRAQAPAEDTPARPSSGPRSSDAPWHHARPTFDEPEPSGPAEASEPSAPEPTASDPKDPADPEAPTADPGPGPGRDRQDETPEDPTGGPQ